MIRPPKKGEIVWSEVQPIGHAVVKEVDRLFGTGGRFLVHVLHYGEDDPKVQGDPVQATWYKDADFNDNFTRQWGSRYDWLTDEEEWLPCLDTVDDG